MPGGEHSQGALGELLIEPGAGPHTFDASSVPIEFLSETISSKGRLGGNNGIRGTLQVEAARTRKLTTFIYGTVTMYVSPNDVANLCVNVLGMTESPAGTFTMDDSLPYFGSLIRTDNTVTTTIEPIEFRDCMLNNWILLGRAPQFGEQGEPEMLILQLGIISSIENNNVSWPSPAPSLGTAAADAPYIFSDSDSGITLAASTRDVQQFVLSVNYGTYAKYVNSLTAHSHRPTKRDIQLAVQVPHNADNDDLYDQAVAGAAASLVFTNGAFSTTINLGRWQVPIDTPIIRGKGEVPLNLRGRVAGTGATTDMVIVNDNNP